MSVLTPLSFSSILRYRFKWGKKSEDPSDEMPSFNGLKRGKCTCLRISGRTPWEESEVAGGAGWLPPGAGAWPSEGRDGNTETQHCTHASFKF